MLDRNIHLCIVTDCGGSDRGRYEIAAGLCFAECNLTCSFFTTASMNPFHSGFTAAAHALSTVSHFAHVRGKTNVGILVNAAPRHGSENGHKLRGDDRKRSGEEIYALRLKDGSWVVGPNAGTNLFFLKEQVTESFVVTDSRNPNTPFRSMEIMVPTLAKVLGAHNFSNIALTRKKLQTRGPEPGIYVADWDSHGNIYLYANTPGIKWLPRIGKIRVFRIGNKIARLRHVAGIFAGKTGEQTLTKGSLKLNGQPIYYIVVVGGNAHSLLGNPEVGTKLEIETE